MDYAIFVCYIQRMPANAWLQQKCFPCLFFPQYTEYDGHWDVTFIGQAYQSEIIDIAMHAIWKCHRKNNIIRDNWSLSPVSIIIYLYLMKRCNIPPMNIIINLKPMAMNELRMYLAALKETQIFTFCSTVHN